MLTELYGLDLLVVKRRINGLLFLLPRHAEFLLDHRVLLIFKPIS